MIIDMCASVKLVPVNITDASFILSLRLNKTLNKFVSPVSNSLKLQEKWIVDYKIREVEKREFYFIIKDREENSLGTARIYNFKGDKFCWGSWMLNAPHLKTAAIESVMSIYEFGFYILGFNAAYFDVRRENAQVIKFHKMMGAIEVAADELDVYLELQKAAYDDMKQKFSFLFLPKDQWMISV